MIAQKLQFLKEPLKAGSKEGLIAPPKLLKFTSKMNMWTSKIINNSLL